MTRYLTSKMFILRILPNAPALPPNWAKPLRPVLKKLLLHEVTALIEAEMAERFFKKEVQKSYLGEGQEFCDDGIFAAPKALLAEMNLSTGGRP
ncbi:MAG TPA: hypothetical protein VFR24_05620 [Candidatus Angelobacter sp.]|nr:hypothetical protein [Candidatus Angelobacter sp.]